MEEAWSEKEPIAVNDLRHTSTNLFGKLNERVSVNVEAM